MIQRRRGVLRLRAARPELCFRFNGPASQEGIQICKTQRFLVESVDEFLGSRKLQALVGGIRIYVWLSLAARREHVISGLFYEGLSRVGLVILSD